MTTLSLEAELDNLLAGGPEWIGSLERSMAESPALADGSPFILFGSGTLGRWTLTKLRRAGVQPSAFADNNKALWGKEIDGLRVLSPGDAAQEFGRDVPIFVTIYTGAKVREQLRGLHLRVFSFPVLALRFPEALMPHNCVEMPSKMAPHSVAIREGLSVWSDHASRQEYVAQVRYRLTFDENLPLSLPPSDTYFPEDLVSRSSDEVFVDCGAYDGDSIREFLRRRGEAFRRIIALEPDPQNIARLFESLSSYPESVRQRVEAIAVAAGKERGKAIFDATGTVGSSVVKGAGIEVDIATLDECLGAQFPSYIKMDIEGSEPSALAGACRILQEDEPVLAICLYHRQEDLWQIPLQIKAANSRYHLFLRRYSDDCWEQVCYAIPASRLQPGALDGAAL